MKIELNINKKQLLLFTLAAFFFTAAIVYAYNSSPANPAVFGHSADEIYVLNSSGQLVTLQNALNELKNPSVVNQARKSQTYEIYNADTTTYPCLDVNLSELCGDEDGCDIRLELQYEIDSYDQVRTIDEHIFMEQESMSNDLYSGKYGWTRQEGGGDYSWITGIANQYTIFNPWDWIYMYNYKHAYCPGQTVNGPAYADPYKFTIMSHPMVRSRVIVYD